MQLLVENSRDLKSESLVKDYSIKFQMKFMSGWEWIFLILNPVTYFKRHALVCHIVFQGATRYPNALMEKLCVTR